MTTLEMLTGMRVLSTNEEIKWYVKPHGISASFLVKMVRRILQLTKGRN